MTMLLSPNDPLLRGNAIRPLKDMLKPWVRSVVNERSFDSNWYLSVLVAIVWAAVIAATVVSLDYDGSKADITREIFGTVVVVLLASLVTTNPGAVIVAVWGALWLVPTGFAFATRSIFDITDRLIHRLNLYLRRMARESLSHFQASDRAEGLVNLKTVILIFQVLPLIPLFALFIPMPFLYFSIWVIHLSLRALLLVSDLIIAPASTFRLYPLLSDYGSVTWKMAHLDMSVERSSMRTMLKRRISKLMENGKLGDMVRNGVIPPSPYSHLGQGPPRLGCVALVTEESGDRVLKADRDSSRRTVSGAGGV